jgi:hypothetical protein
MYFIQGTSNYLDDSYIFCYSSLLSDSGASEDEGFNSLSSPFATLQRHSSLGKDEPDDDRSFRHMHRLR